MKPFLLAIAFMAFAAPVMAERGRGQICKSRAGSASRQSGRTLTARVAIVARAIAITILLAISGAFYCTRVCGQTF